VTGERFSRNEALFGAEGQDRLGGAHVAIVGVGGIGSHVAQQLAYLGSTTFTVIDFDVVEETNLNRLIGATPADVVAATKKVDVAARTVAAILPDAVIHTVDAAVASATARGSLAHADVIFGCIDRDIHRVELTETAARLAVPYFDCATDTSENNTVYGGRVILSDGTQCLVCLPEVLDQRSIAEDRLNGGLRDAHDRIYGIARDALGRTGPSVVSINGVVASLAVTEYMALVTGLRKPLKQLTYRADTGVVRVSRDRPEAGCYYCAGLWGIDRRR
jgi:molybdopterin/thiamine biosynthesis adenylyltransferase